MKKKQGKKISDVWWLIEKTEGSGTSERCKLKMVIDMERLRKKEQRGNKK